MTKLRQARYNLGLKREYVAKELGITGDHLNLLERGTTKLDLLKIQKLSQIFNISLEEMANIALETIEGSEKINAKRTNKTRRGLEP